MSKITVQSEIDLQTLLTRLFQMKIYELESIAQELNALIVRKKHKTSKSQDAELLLSINECVLNVEKLRKYKVLLQKLENETITEKENKISLNLVKEEEGLRNQRIGYMVQLAQLRQISLGELMIELGITPPNSKK